MDDIPLIIDFGSQSTKSGYYQADRKTPTYITPSIVGRPRRRFVNQYPPEVCYVGDESIEHRHHLSLSLPIDHGHVENWLEFEELFAYVVLLNKSSLSSEPISGFLESAADTEPYFKDTPLVLTVPPGVSSKHLENIAEIALEMFSFPEILFATGGTLSLFGQGRDTGLTVEIGHGITQIVPTISGFCDKTAVKRVDVGGVEVSMFLQKLLCDSGFSLTSRMEFEQVEIIKERCLYMSVDPNHELESDASSIGYTHVLPDGHTLRSGQSSVNVTREIQYLVPEVIFDPSLVHRDDPGLTTTIWNCLRDCSVDNRRSLLSGMTLAGGGSLIQGIGKRLEAEIAATCPKSAASDVRVVENSDRQYSAWMGGALLSNPDFRKSQDKSWVTRQLYAEQGARVLVERQM